MNLLELFPDLHRIQKPPKERKKRRKCTLFSQKENNRRYRLHRKVKKSALKDVKIYVRKRVSDNEDVVNVIKTHDLESGYNPFNYAVVNQQREDFIDLTVGEICEILEKEMSK